MNDKMPIVTLKSGLRVGNFSSPHEFKFVTGEVLAACSSERAKALMLDTTEVEEKNYGWTDIQLKFFLSDNVRVAINTLPFEDVDVVIVPLPVKRAIDGRKAVDRYSLEMRRAEGICRVCRVADRVTKTIYGDKFCL